MFLAIFLRYGDFSFWLTGLRVFLSLRALRKEPSRWWTP